METKKYNRGTHIITNGMMIDACFKIKSGMIAEIRENETINHYYQNDYLLLSELFSLSKTTSTYIAIQNTCGIWISKNEIIENCEFYLRLLSSKIQKEKALNELILINNPLMKLSRYLYYCYQNMQIDTIYLHIKIADLCSKINLKHQDFLEAISFLEKQNIIKRGNKLINILNPSKLKIYAF